KTTIQTLLLVRDEWDDETRAAVIELCDGRTQVHFIDASLGDITSRLKGVEDAGTTLPLVFSKPKTEFERLADFQDIVVVVNSQLASPVRGDETARLIDLLF